MTSLALVPPPIPAPGVSGTYGSRLILFPKASDGELLSGAEGCRTPVRALAAPDIDILLRRMCFRLSPYFALSSEMYCR